MKLDQFIRETLLEIIRGVEEAKDAAGTGVVSIMVKNEKHYLPGKTPKVLPTYEGLLSSGKFLSEVEYDVAVQVTEGTNTGGKGGLNIGVTQIGAEGSSEASETSTHRIRFKVPVTFYVTEEEKAPKDLT